MKTYELSGETSCTINKQTLYTSHRKYFYEAKNEEDAIKQFKNAKGQHIKKIKAKQVL